MMTAGPVAFQRGRRRGRLLLLLLEFEEEFELELLELFDDEFEEELLELFEELLLELLLELFEELFESQATLKAPFTSAALAGAASTDLAGMLAWADPAASAPATKTVNLVFISLSIQKKSYAIK
jgi:hypothetical protein